MDGKKEHKDDWFSRIADQLREHTESYKEGAWERFDTKYAATSSDSKGGVPPAGKAKGLVRRIGGWKWGAAAAIVVILSGLFVIYNDFLGGNDDTQDQLVAGSVRVEFPKMESPAVEPPFETPGSASDPVSSNAAESISPELMAVQSTETPALADAVITAVANSPRIATVFDPVLVAPVRAATELSTMAGEFPIQRLDVDFRPAANEYAWLEDDLAVWDVSIDSDRDEKQGVQTDNRWNLGLALASSMTTEKLNLGGGLNVSYRLTDRLSISSGLMVSRIGVNGQGANPIRGAMADGPVGSSGINAPLSSASVANMDKERFELAAHADRQPAYYTRSLRSATSNLLTLDVPVNLTFSINKSFYTAMGVSLLGIVDEVRTHHYIDHLNEPMFGGASSTGQDITSSVQATYVEEVARVQPLEGTSYAGFLNFSVGHRTSLGKKMNLSFEPFFKLPVGRLSRADMNLTNGGIRIVTGF